MNFLLFSTKKGLVKRTNLSEYQNIRGNGLIAIKLAPGDELLSITQTSGNDEIILITALGKSIRFAEEKVRASGRAAIGVRGIRLKKEGDRVIGMDAIKSSNLQLLVVSEHGFGKRTPAKEYHRQGRGGGGIFTAKITAKTGKLVEARLIDPESVEDLLVISQKGQTIRLPLKQVPTLGRQTQGVKLINLGEGDTVASLTCLEKEVAS